MWRRIFGKDFVRIRVLARLSILGPPMVFVACTVLPLYRTAYVSKSPSGDTEVRVTRNFPGSDAEYRFRIEISQGRRNEIVFANSRGSALGLIEANWSPDGRRVGLLICNWSRPFFFGYDLSTGHTVDPAVFRHLIEAQLRRKYGEAAAEDIVYWACTRGSVEYQRRSSGR
jgi:hypothetical protein